MSKCVTTRGVVKICPIFGKPEELYRHVLPTIEECLKYILFVQNNLVKQKVNNNCLNSRTFTTVAEVVEDIWKRASIPVVSRQRIIFLLKQYHNRRLALLKSFKRDNQKQSFRTSLTDFKQSTKSLFDIAVCKCSDYRNCRCEKIFKVSFFTPKFK